jgi:hypothetical protein
MSKHFATILSSELPNRQQSARISPLMLCDHLIQSAQEADKAGYVQTASHLVALVDGLFDAAPPHH